MTRPGKGAFTERYNRKREGSLGNRQPPFYPALGLGGTRTSFLELNSGPQVSALLFAKRARLGDKTEVESCKKRSSSAEQSSAKVSELSARFEQRRIGSTKTHLLDRCFRATR